jgi:leucyl-tRNA synthetase
LILSFFFVANIEALSIWRFEDPVCGPRKIPAFQDFKSGKLPVAEGTFSIDALKREIFLCGAGNEKIIVGTNLIYVVD